MSNKLKVLLGLGLYFAITIALLLIVGDEGRNEEFQPQNEFKLDPWIEINLGGIDLSINKAVFYLLLASGLTVATMTFIARRMQREPNRVQMAVELAYDLVRNNITRGNIPDERLATRWFPFLGGLFFFIWFSNIIGFLPLPINTEHKVDVFGLEVPSLALYAATANLSIPLVLTLVVWFSYHIEGIRVKGFVGFAKSYVPPGMSGLGAVPLFVIEVISDFVRIISLSVRLFANILAGHLLILFMGGGLVVLLGLAWLGALTLPVAIVFFLFEVVLIATLQAFIFATLTAIYLGSAVEAH